MILWHEMSTKAVISWYGGQVALLSLGSHTLIRKVHITVMLQGFASWGPR